MASMGDRQPFLWWEIPARELIHIAKFDRSRYVLSDHGANALGPADFLCRGLAIVCRSKCLCVDPQRVWEALGSGCQLL
jgi:hypothetical protein